MKRKSLKESVRVAEAVSNVVAMTGTPESRVGGEKHVSKSISLTESDWDMLRDIAWKRAKAKQKGASVSKIIENLINAHRQELEREML